MTNTTDVKYDTKSIKTVRGLEARTRAKYEKEGWEFVSQTQGTLRSELNFRRVAPTVPWKWIGLGAGVVAIFIVVIVLTTSLGGGDDDEGTPVAVSPSQTAATTAAPSSAPAAPSKTASASATPAPAAPTAKETTVDALLDKLNSTGMGGIKVGDQFHLTGELFMSDLWMTGATGDFYVLLKAQDGAQDLSVFVDESDAAEWQDGTRVDMIVQMVEATINGETTDGWLRAESVKTL